MQDLINLIDNVLAAVGQSCTQCLIDDFGNDAADLGDTIVDLNTAYLMRSILPNGEDNFTRALARYLSLVTKMAILTTELNGRPGIRWIDESAEIAIPIINIPN
jgi:hypothetical protein